MLLIASLVCLGSWIVMFKLAGKTQRFELFSIDFVLGALLFSLLAAFTLGNTASDLTFGDQLLLSGRTAQALVFLAGLIFGIASLLLLGAVSLLGIAAAAPLCIGMAVIANALIDFRSYSVTALLAGIVLLALGMLASIWASRLRFAAAIPGKKPAQQPGAQRVRTMKGLIVALIAGVALGATYPLAEGGIYGDVGVGPYGSLLFFCAGSLISTLLLSLFSFNIALEGNRLAFSAYFGEPRRQHLFGIAGGIIWSAGALAALIAKSAMAAESAWSQTFFSFLPVAAALVAMAWGGLVYKEFASAPSKPKLSLAIAAVLLVCGSWLIHAAHSV